MSDQQDQEQQHTIPPPPPPPIVTSSQEVSESRRRRNKLQQQLALDDEDISLDSSATFSKSSSDSEDESGSGENEVILILPNNRRSYFSGEILVGHIQATIEKPILLDALTVSLRGVERVTEDSNQHKNKFLKKTVRLEVQNSGNESQEKSQSDKVLLRKGVHRIPFSIEIPRVVPPSFENQIATIEYKLKTKLKPAEDDKQLLRYVKPLQLHGSLFDQNTIAKANSGDLSVSDRRDLDIGSVLVNVAVDSKILTPGSFADLHIDVTNTSTNERVTAISCKLVQKTIVTREEKVLFEQNKDIAFSNIGQVLSQEEVRADRKLAIPSSAGESIVHQINDQSVVYGKYINVTYLILVQVDIQGKEEITFEIPVYIVKGKDEEYELEKPATVEYHEFNEHSAPPRTITKPNHISPSKLHDPEPSTGKSSADTQQYGIPIRAPTINYNVYHHPVVYSPSTQHIVEERVIYNEPDRFGIIPPQEHIVYYTKEEPLPYPNDHYSTFRNSTIRTSEKSPISTNGGNSEVRATSPPRRPLKDHSPPKLTGIHHPSASPRNPYERHSYVNQSPSRSTVVTNYTSSSPVSLSPRRYVTTYTTTTTSPTSRLAELQTRIAPSPSNKEFLQRTEKNSTTSVDKLNEEENVIHTTIEDTKKTLEYFNNVLNGVTEIQTEVIESSPSKLTITTRTEYLTTPASPSEEVNEATTSTPSKKQKEEGRFDYENVESREVSTPVASSPSKKGTGELRVFGGKYKGDHIDGIPNGHGVMIYTNGSKYTGNWLNGKKHGSGKMEYSDGAVFDGEWQKDARHGWGFYSTTTYKYDGQWYNDMKHGKGLIVYNNGEQYEGQWNNNYPSGTGGYTFKDGSTYKGTFFKGLRHGRGILEYKDGSMVYDGDFVEDRKHGRALITFNNGVYDGEMRDDAREGYGVYRYSNGDSYEGTWLNNKKHGNGLLKFANGGYFKGVWINGHKSGNGELITPEGIRYVERWVNGALVSKHRVGTPY
jgi:hypothetical protein